ncbi:MAG TPA: L,D-transpeptidase [Acidimicrobiia bacterium]|nr:L,D-transpeptidase [Acidimicrobiia bacterium]
MTEQQVRTRAELRHRRRMRSWAIAGVVALVLVVAGAGAVVFTSGSSGRGSATEARPTATTAAKARPVAAPNVFADYGRVPFRAAATKGGDIQVYPAPDPNAAPTATLSQKTDYLLPRTLLAFDQWQDWLHVYLPTRPNDSTGWVKMSDVDVSNPLEWQIRVSLADHHLWLFHNGAIDFETDVAIGTQQYPTPTGTFYITDPVDLHKTPNLGYGVFALGLSGHSDVLTEFGGGDGQIAIHGDNNPGDMGKDVSHGCVRVTNDAIERLSTLPLGTPVEIT